MSFCCRFLVPPPSKMMKAYPVVPGSTGMKLVAAAKSAAMHEIRAESCRCGSNSSMHRADDKPAEAGGTWITWDNGISLR